MELAGEITGYDVEGYFAKNDIADATINGVPVDKASYIFSKDPFNFGDEIVVTILPDSDRVWKNGTSVDNKELGCFYRYLDNVNNGVFHKIYFNYSQDLKTATLVINKPDNFREGSAPEYTKINFLTSVADPVADDPKTIGITKLHKVNDEIITAVLKNTTGVGDNAAPISYASYILAVRQYPFNLPDDYLEEPGDIYLATKNTRIKAEKINSEIVKIDLGTIKTPALGNVLDIKNVKTTLFLPFLDKVDLETNFVVGYDLSIEYEINLINGDVLATINSSKSGGTILYINGNIGADVPYSPENYQPPENTTLTNPLNNSLDCAYVELLDTNSENNNSMFATPIKQSGLITETGFVIVENIELIGNMQSSDKDQIETLLKNGVLIK